MWGVNAQSLTDTPPKGIADARLSHVGDLGCRFLLEAARCKGETESCGAGRRFFQQLMNERLIGLLVLGRHFPQLLQETWREADRDELFRHSTGWPPNPACAPELFLCRLRDVREINL